MEHPVRSAAETYIPDEDEQVQLLELVAALDGRDRASTGAQAGVVTHDGTLHELSPGLTEIVARVCRLLSGGQGVSVVPRHRWLTTQEAADLLGIPRPTLLGLLSEGTVPHEMRGRHRRVRLDDVLGYQDTLRQRREGSLASMQADGQVEGLYELLDGPVGR